MMKLPTPIAIGLALPNDLFRMIMEGRSFSGRERNCCFLNTRDGRFATCSAVSGIDFPDDGRALAVTDWDQDGDLDLWVTDRTGRAFAIWKIAPRRLPVHCHYSLWVTENKRIATRLARIELFVKTAQEADADTSGAVATSSDTDHEPSQPQLGLARRVKRHCVRAKGFLFNGANGVHFGLVDAGEIERVEVTWPARESFTGFKRGQRYELHQGSGQVRGGSA